VLWTLSSGVEAQELSGTPPPETLQVHAFASQGFLLTTGNNFLAKSRRGSFEVSEVGINFTKPLTDKLRTGLQLFARDLGPIGDYTPAVDWYYLDYRFDDRLGFRAGRIKIPLGFYNELADIDSARTPVLLPQSIYPTQNRDFLLAQTGLELYGLAQLGAAGELEYRLFGGTLFFEATPQPGSPVQPSNLETPYAFGGRLLWQPREWLRLGGSLLSLRLDADLLYDRAIWAPLQADGKLPADFHGVVSIQIPARLWVASLEYSLGEWAALTAEYSRWIVDVDSSHPVLFPETPVTSERFYGMVARTWTSWLQTSLYWSVLYPDVDDRKGREHQQHDIAATLRFDLNAHWMLKAEGHLMRGTAGLNRALNDNKPLSELRRDWAAFLVKTTAYF
jgi:hypothetical protein